MKKSEFSANRELAETVNRELCNERKPLTFHAVAVAVGDPKNSKTWCLQ